jgi:drug/metabolite transporter (DMT)-like permease
MSSESALAVRAPSAAQQAVAIAEATTGHTDASPRATNDRPIRGILMVVLSTVFLASSDAIAKYLTQRLPAIEVTWMRFVVFFVIMSAVVTAMGPRRTLATVQPRLQLLRGVMLVGSALFFMSSLRMLPIAEATTTGFVAPVFVTLLSIVFLHEAVGLRRWLATIAGLIGVLVVMRPGTSAFQPATLLVILSALCWSSSLVVTRRMAGHDGTVTTVAYSATCGVVVMSMMLPFVYVTPTATEIALGVCIGLAATTGHWLVVAAYRYADASVLAPLTYAQAISATALGYGVFGEVPDAWTLTGAAIIISSGLYIAHRERVRRAAALRSA